MSTYKQILYQIIYSTKYRENTLCKENRDELFKYKSGILKNKNCHLYQIGGVSENQETHHLKKSFIEELKELLIEHEIEFDERYLL